MGDRRVDFVVGHVEIDELHPLSPSSLRKEGGRSYYGHGGSGTPR